MRQCRRVANACNTSGNCIMHNWWVGTVLGVTHVGPSVVLRLSVGPSDKMI